MPTLDELIGREMGERVLGAYLYPIRVFGGTPATAIENVRVVARVQVAKSELLLTRCGGLFLFPPVTFRDPYRLGAGNEAVASETELTKKADFSNAAAEIFNMVVCEFALLGHTYEPISPVYVVYGRYADEHATISIGGGSGAVNMERQIGPLFALFGKTWTFWPGAPVDIPSRLGNLPMASALAKVSAALPSLVAGAYSHFASRQLAESIADSWIATEQLLDHAWQAFTSELSRVRQTRLSDRSFTANVRAEVLLSAGRISAELYETVQGARRERNNLMHAATVSQTAAQACAVAMKASLEHYLGLTVAPPEVSTTVSW